MSEAGSEETGAVGERVTTLELFLDLVFVFTVTQLTQIVSGSHPWTAYGKAVLILGITWWMYDGYVWLTGNVRLDEVPNRLALFVGMGGFLTMAIAIPSAFSASSSARGDGGVIFGLAFVVVTLVHMGLFAAAPNQSARAIWRIAPFNLTGAVLVVVAGLFPPDHRWPVWVAAALVLMSSSVFGRGRGWVVSAGHFVERHGLVIIVALGESVVDVGVGASGSRIGARLVIAAMLGLALSASLWWLYFDSDDQFAGDALSATPGDGRSILGLQLAYTHLAMIAGIVVMSAGVKLVVADPNGRAVSGDAWNLAAGAAIYVLGEHWFRMTMGARRSLRTPFAAALLIATVPLGMWVSGLAQLAATVAVMVVLLVLDRRSAARAA